jgi:mannosyltransferase OCH1-like enzyme
VPFFLNRLEVLRKKSLAYNRKVVMAIPKIIHYCWFGDNSMPENEAKCIANWREVLPDYEFKLWNEHNFDVNSTRFTKQVASVYKWGFIVDYIRAYAIFNYGGIYLDVDVEVIKSFDDLLDSTCFVGFEDEHHVNPGSAFAGEKGCAVALDMMNFYKDYEFINKDGSLNLTPSPQILSRILLVTVHQ